MFDFSYFPRIETERLLLRQLAYTDAPAILAEFNDPRVTEHLDPDPPIVDLDSAKAFIDWTMEWFAAKHGWRWAVVLKSSDTMIGTAGFHRWSKLDRRCEIGYDYSYQYWGQGYATEVVQRMIQFGFEEMNLHRLEADCNEDNFGSARVLEKAGMTYEGLWRDRIWEKGKFVGLKQFSILESEYRKKV